jgi:acyl carrier protein
MYSAEIAEILETSAILEKVRSLLAHHLCLTPDAIAPSATLDDELGVDSLDFIELSIALEDNFGVTIGPVQASRFRTVFDVAAFLRSQMSAGVGEPVGFALPARAASGVQVRPAVREGQMARLRAAAACWVGAALGLTRVGKAASVCAESN